MHWGANAFPPVDPEFRIGISLNRFTEFSKSGGRFNDTRETLGFNMLNLWVSDQVPSFPDLTFDVFVGAGPTNDQPTRFLQNEFLHNIWGLDRVPVDDTRTGWDFMAGGSLTWSRERNLGSCRGRLFGGVGAAFGSLYDEPFVDGGIELHVPGLNVKVGVMDRFSWPRESDAFDELSDRTNIAQLYLGYVPERIDRSSFFLWDWLGVPEAGVTLSHNSGLFLESVTKDPIDMWFISGRVRWPTGLMFEMWNDIINGTDFGPTMGLSISVDVLTLFRDQRWL